jgi:hypothetical protein
MSARVKDDTVSARDLVGKPIAAPKTANTQKTDEPTKNRGNDQ